ncbi:MAG: hypothetical protein VR72_05165 [Clostridiaceae bacterium BRH_c20a]|nr:MAG: hypothetical protein VR72_05165 [Clostridiaceae bacterium BRH_c20a]
MVKVTGAILVIMAMGTVGLVVARNYSLRPQQLRYLLNGLQMLETEMLYCLTPLPLALKRVGMKLPYPISQFFLNTSTSLTNGEGITAGEAWEMALGELAEESALLMEELDILLYFSQSLGVADREEQGKSLRLVKEQLMNMEKKAEELKEKNQKLWQYLGFSLGAVIALVLI